jgi:hypothetical protein
VWEHTKRSIYRSSRQQLGVASAATYFNGNDAERTLETANGLATGMFPASSIQVSSQPT